MFKQKFKSKYALMAVFFTLAAGLIHSTLAAYAHKEIWPELGFFVSIGLAQIVWAILFLKKKSEFNYATGVILNGSVLIMWALTRTIAAPFVNEPEAVGAIDFLTAILETISVASLLLWHEKAIHFPSLIKRTSREVAIMLVVGFFLYQSGFVVAGFFPDIEGHSHSDKTEYVDEAPHDDQSEDGHDTILKEVTVDKEHNDEDDHPHE